MSEHSSPLHRAQASVLEDLRHTDAARYSALQRAAGLESDAFKFHLRKLVQLGYVRKMESGLYTLTASGKEFANNLHEPSRAVQKQPKLSVMVVASQVGPTGEKRYLFQQRRRNPYFGFWGCVGGPVQWGEPIKAAAGRELAKQTGLQADCEVVGFYRKRDYAADDNGLLEDKLFAVVLASRLEGELRHDWPHGHNAWMTADELAKQEAYFASTYDFIDMVAGGRHYMAVDAAYDRAQY